MPENTKKEPILPIPSDLDQRTWQAREALDALRHQIQTLHEHYGELHNSPESLRTDNLGQPMQPSEATSAAQMWLASTGRALSAAEDGLRRANSYTTRLSLTDQASEEREARVQARKDLYNGRRPRAERTR
ncbi:hypothetical protein ACFWFQ_08290 [Nocardia salmonicida]|uniref:hypothetical protein n=1 Tax=Nocardia salmonicida TaxID=53431 RepID=UPI00365983A0